MAVSSAFGLGTNQSSRNTQIKYTLLDLVQTILSSMDGDEVNSISDTIESQQVATIVRTSYMELIGNANLDEHFTLFNLSATTEDTPTKLTRPANIDYLKWFKYNKRTTDDTTDKWGLVEYLDPEAFLQHVQDFDQEADNVESYVLTADGYNTTVYFRNDKAPEWWTSFDDDVIVCDSYDVGVEAFLQSSKTACFGKMNPTWVHEDDYTPDLDDQQFALLLNEAKALAWAELKQTTHARAERKARQSWIKLEKQKQDLPGGDRTWRQSLPNYGRRR